MRRIRVLTDEIEITAAVVEMRTDRLCEPFLCTGTSGLLGFAAAIFADADGRDIYVRKFERPPRGRGSHFDVYLDFLRHDQPWLGVYNLSGHAAVRMFALPDHMARVYNERFPSASREGYECRRHYSALALNDMTEAPATGVLVEGTGLVIPQQRDGFQWVHEIVPVDPACAGEFLKFVVPRDKRGVLWEIGYRPLETVISNGLSLAQDLFDEGDMSAAERAAKWHEIRID